MLPNFAKSGFGAFGEMESWQSEAADYLNCSLLTLPFTYLGVPIGANPRRYQTWDPIISKCEKISEVETEKFVFQGESDSFKVSANILFTFSLFIGFLIRWWIS